MNDIFRRQYRQLTETEKEFIDNLKHQAEIVYGLMDQSTTPGERSEKARYLEMAKTALEEAVMWAVKGLSL